MGLLPCVWGERKGPLLPPHTFIRFLNKINNLFYFHTKFIFKLINLLLFSFILAPLYPILSESFWVQFNSICSAEHKGIYFEESYQKVTRLFWGTIDFHSRNKKHYGSQWCPRTALFPTFFRISSFFFGRTKIFMQVWMYWVSKWWQNFDF